MQIKAYVIENFCYVLSNISEEIRDLTANDIGQILGTNTVRDHPFKRLHFLGGELVKFADRYRGSLVSMISIKTIPDLT